MAVQSCSEFQAKEFLVEVVYVITVASQKETRRDKDKIQAPRSLFLQAACSHKVSLVCKVGPPAGVQALNSWAFVGGACNSCSSHDKVSQMSHKHEVISSHF